GDKRDEGRTVRVILEPLDGRSDVPGTALEVDVAVLLLVTAGDPARRHVALVVAAAGLALAFGQRLDGLALPQRRLVDEDEAAACRGSRLILLQCHDLDPARDVDRIALGEGNDRLLGVRASVGTALPLHALA